MLNEGDRVLVTIRPLGYWQGPIKQEIGTANQEGCIKKHHNENSQHQ